MVRIPEATSIPSVEPFHSVKIAAHELARKIGESGDTFDRVAFLPFSGAMVLTLVGEQMGFNPTSDVLTLPFARNPNFPEDSRIEFKVGTLPPREEVEAMNILLLGDVWRTGRLLRRSAQSLGTLGAGMVKIGVMYKRTDHLLVGQEPDYFGLEAKSGVLFEWHSTPQSYAPITSVRRVY